MSTLHNYRTYKVRYSCWGINFLCSCPEHKTKQRNIEHLLSFIYLYLTFVDRQPEKKPDLIIF